MSDEVTLNINFGDSGDNTPKSDSSDPFKGIKPLSKEDLLDAFPPKDDFKQIFKQLKTLTAEDAFNSADIGKSIEDVFKDLPTLSDATTFDSSIVGGLEQSFKKLETTLQSFDSSIVGFLPEDFEDKLDNFFKAIEEDTEAFFAQRDALDQLLESQNDSFQNLFDEIGGVASGFLGVANTTGAVIAGFTGFIVGVSLYNAALKEVLNSLGEFAGQFKAEQAEVARDLLVQSLENSQRLDAQLATNESIRGAMTGELEQLKTELFDLLSPVIIFVTGVLTLILKAINTLLAAVNFIKDVVGAPISLISTIIGLLNPMAEKARRDLRTKTKDDLNKLAPGLGDLNDLSSLGSIGRTTQDLPPGLFDDVVNHPFEGIDDLSENPFDNPPPASGNGGGGSLGGGGGQAWE